MATRTRKKPARTKSEGRAARYVRVVQRLPARTRVVVTVSKRGAGNARLGRWGWVATVGGKRVAFSQKPYSRATHAARGALRQYPAAEIVWPAKKAAVAAGAE